MNDLLSLLGDLSLLLGASAFVAYVGFRFFGMVPIVGFLLAGVAVGPNALGLVSDPTMVDTAAEIGVILLLFTIGIEFSLERLGRIRRLIFGGGTLQVLLSGGVVTSIMLGLSVPWRPALYTGLLATVSSTVIALKLLADRGATGSPEGQAALGISLFQDLAVIPMVLLLPALSGTGDGRADLLPALGRAAAIIVVALVVARRLMPPFLERVARACSPDIFLLTLVALCFGTAWLAALAGAGLSLGAFLAGLVVSESRFSQHAFSEVLPLRILFSAAFFVSVGMLLDPAFLLQHPALVLALVGGLLIVKATTTIGALHLLGTPLRTSIPAGLLLGQVGEISFVLERQGSALGLYPGGSAELGGQAFIAATVLLMMATPMVAGAGPALTSRLSRSSVPPGPEVPPEPTGASVLVGGYGDAARRLTRYLKAAGLHPMILTLSPEGARAAEAEGFQVLRGDYGRQSILEAAGLPGAALMVVADDDAATTERVVSVARTLAPKVQIMARTARVSDVAALERAGADLVVAAEGAADRELARSALGAAGVSPDDIALVLAGLDADGPGVRLGEAATRSPRCAHAADLGVVRPRTPTGCEECLAEGRTWVHLRICMTCGHVGCCDDSPGRHATAHFNGTGHPVVRSWEPGEDWAWCYVDEVRL